MKTKGSRITIISVSALIAFSATLFLHGYLITEGDHQVATTVEQDPSLPHIKIGDNLFHAEAFGHDTCPTVIVLHGGPGYDYRSLLYLKELADEYHMVFYDRRGTGLSPRVNIDELTPDTMLNDLLGITLYFAGQRKVNLVAFSWGGKLALLFKETYPDRVDQLTILDPQPSSEDTRRGFFYARDMGMNWFKSLHVREPDPQAARDFFYTCKASYFISGEQGDTSCSFWRCSALAGEAFPGKIYNKEIKEQVSASTQIIPLNEADKIIYTIRNYFNK